VSKDEERRKKILKIFQDKHPGVDPKTIVDWLEMLDTKKLKKED